MLLREFAKEYPELWEAEVDPYEYVRNADWLPYDDICMVPDVGLAKVVYMSNDEVISVAELLSYSEEDAKKDPYVYEVWQAYMQKIELEPAIKDISKLLATWRASL